MRHSLAQFGCALALLGSLAQVSTAQCPSWSIDADHPQYNERFATAVATSGGRWVSGGPGHLGYGRAQVYSVAPDGAVFEGFLWPGDLANQDGFGSAVAIDGLTVVVGSPGDDDGTFGAGSAYVFELKLGKWIQTAKLQASWPGSNASFGTAVAISGDWIAVGAPFDSTVKTYGGRVSVFQRTSAGWVLEYEYAGGAPLERFGAALDLDGDQLVIGAPGASRVETFDLDAGTWVPGQVLTAAGASASDEFGSALALEGGLLVVGARSDSKAAPGAGAAFVFGHSGGAWEELQRLEADLPMASDRFGSEVEIQGEFIAVGAPGADTAGLEAGAVTFFAGGAINGSTYTPFDAAQTLVPLGAKGSEHFGSTIAMSAVGMWVGAPGEDTMESNAGRAHAFSFVDIGCASLSVGPEEVSSHAPSKLQFEIDAGAAFAGEPYFMLGTSQSYTTPTLLSGVLIPLTGPDWYTHHLLNNVNKNGQKSTAAYLDANGRGKATIDLTTVPQTMVNGSQLSHVFFCFNEHGQTTFVSSVAKVDVIW